MNSHAIAGLLPDLLPGSAPHGLARPGRDEIGQFLREDLITFTRQGLRPQTPQNDTIVIPYEEGDIVFQIEPSLLSSTAQ